MCNLYSARRSQSEILELSGAMRDNSGNLPPISVYPDYAAPIVRTGADGIRELTMARWGMPTPPAYLEGKRVDKGITNIRNTNSSHWRRWLSIASRCLVPFDAFSEPGRIDGKFTPIWFALSEDRPLAFFAGIWTSWTSTRKLAEGPVTTDLFAFLTTSPNAIVAPIHAKAMPVILTSREEQERWLSAEWPEAGKLQRPLPDDQLQRIPA